MNFTINRLLARDPYALEVFADYLEENSQQSCLHLFLRTRQHEEKGFCDGIDRKDGDGFGDGWVYGNRNGDGTGYGDGYGAGYGMGYRTGYYMGDGGYGCGFGSNHGDAYGDGFGDGYGLAECYGYSDQGNQYP
jgi:hypothetical protein